MLDNRDELDYDLDERNLVIIIGKVDYLFHLLELFVRAKERV